MTGFGIRQDEIATSLRIDKKTLHKHFRRELDTGMIEANTRVAQALYTNATKNMNVTAQIWWTKTRMGWKDTMVLEGQADNSLTALHLIAARQIADQMQMLIASGTKPNGHANGNGATIEGDAIDYTKPALE